MPKQNTWKSFFSALLSGVAILVIALIVELVRSTTGSRGNGISAYAGGVSTSFINVATLAFPIMVLILFFLFRRVFRE